MAEDRSVETVRREIGAERQGLARALDRLRAETAEAKRTASRRAKTAALFLVAATGVAAATRFVLKRMRD